MSQESLTVVAIIRAHPDHIDDVRDGLRGLIAPTLKEEGCINYDLHQDQEDPCLFVFHENWESGALLDQHLESAHIKAFQSAIEGKIESVDVRRMNRVSAE